MIKKYINNEYGGFFNQEEGIWYDKDGKPEQEIILSNNSKCKNCNLKTPEGHDYCFGELPGVKYACCGHGEIGYITFNNGLTIEFNLTKIIRKS